MKHYNLYKIGNLVHYEHVIAETMLEALAIVKDFEDADKIEIITEMVKFPQEIIEAMSKPEEKEDVPIIWCNKHDRSLGGFGFCVTCMEEENNSKKEKEPSKILYCGHHDIHYLSTKHCLKCKEENK